MEAAVTHHRAYQGGNAGITKGSNRGDTAATGERRRRFADNSRPKGLLFLQRCGIPKELTALIGIAEKAGDMKATVEVTNGRGDPTAVRKRTDTVNHITSLKNLIVII